MPHACQQAAGVKPANHFFSCEHAACITALFIPSQFPAPCVVCCVQVTFPPQYPFKPPSIVMLTPNGRFATNTKLCLRGGWRVGGGGRPAGGGGGGVPGCVAACTQLAA